VWYYRHQLPKGHWHYICDVILTLSYCSIAPTSLGRHHSRLIVRVFMFYYRLFLSVCHKHYVDETDDYWQLLSFHSWWWDDFPGDVKCCNRSCGKREVRFFVDGQSTHLTASFTGKPGQAGTRKFGILMNHEMIKWKWHRADHSESFFTGRMYLLRTTNSVKALKTTGCGWNT